MDEESIFLQALEKPTLAERVSFLENACAGDLGLRRDIELLLDAHERAGDFLAAKPPIGPTIDQQVGESPGSVIGPYRLLEQIGEGGFGVVFMAEQQHPVRRKVALKVVKPGMDTRQVIARFEAERQALALMDHPNIARVFDGGETASGRPYFVMELVKGIPITDYCDEAQLTARERLELFSHVCRAVQHAHQKGIIHRDLKPSNVLITLHDGTPVVKVIDFGIAKATGKQLTDKTLFTNFAQLVGTPLYMSPEQASLSGLDVDTRSDIYVLGVLLYELLTGTTPFDKERFKEAGYDEIRRILREEDPPRPSARLSTLGQGATVVSAQRRDPKRLSQLFKGELDWIVMKCLEKDRNRRYETADALALDLERYQKDEPVQACPPSALYRLRKFSRRNKGALLTGSVVAPSVLAALVVLAISNVSVTREKEQKEIALAEAEANLLLARQAVDEIYTPVAQQLAVLPHMQPFQRDVLEKVLRFYREFAQRKSTDPAIRLETAHAALQIVQIQQTLGERGGTEQACRQAIVALEQLATELPSEPKRRLDLGAAYGVLSAIHWNAGRRQEGARLLRQALVLYDDLVTEHPGVPEYRRRLAAAMNTLGARAHDQPQQAERRHREAIRLCEQLRAERPDEPHFRGELANSYRLLGHLFSRTQRLAKAEEAFRQASAVFEEAREQMNQSMYRFLLPEAQHALALVLARRGRPKDAETAFRHAITLAETHASHFPDISSYRQHLAVYSLEFAKFLRQTGRPQDAAPFGNAAGQLTEKLLADFIKDNPPTDQALADLTAYGLLLRDGGELHHAEQVLRKALEVAKKLAADSAGESSRWHRLARCHYGLGMVLQKAVRFREAGDSYRESLAIYEKLAAALPADPDYRLEQASISNFLGVALRNLPDQVETVQTYHRRAVDISGRLVAEFPDKPRYRRELTRSHYALGVALALAGRWRDAETAFTRALADAVPPGNDSDADALVASIHNEWAWLLATCPDEKFRDPKRARELARKAVEGDPRYGYWNTLGVAHYRAGSWQESLTALRKSMELHSGGDGFDWFFVAMAHWRLGEKQKARTWYDRAVDWTSKHRPNDAELRRFRGEAAELLDVPKK